jgi:GNAT superfamily N-acetyltransferase
LVITFEPADAGRDRAVLTELNVAYLDWLDANIQQRFGLDLPALLGQPIVEYVAATLDKLCAAEPPEGVFYLVRRDGGVVGMGGVRRTGDGASEMKRVFVRPDQRGGGLGATIVRRLIADATSFGYASMRLDSGPFMTSAHRLYEAEGFRDRPIYDGAEVPSELHHNWRFMERSLR